MYGRPEAYRKGLNIVEFWVRTAMTPFGAPQNCYNPTIKGFEPMPFWTRMIADGLENILDAYVYMKKKGAEKPDWLDFCIKAADRFVRIQNEDGSWYRAYNTEDDSMRMDSKANTISVVRFLIQLFLVTGNEAYRQSALRAGEWAHQNTFRDFGYAQPGLSHEGGHFAGQVFMSHYHWLPWVTYVEVDPVSRLYDTFGAYDIAGADRLDPQERARRNRIYDHFA